MSFLSRLFNKQKQSDDETIAKTKVYLSSQCYCAALWHSAAKLKQLPGNHDARAVFDSALPNVVVHAVPHPSPDLTEHQQAQQRIHMERFYDPSLTDSEIKVEIDYFINVFFIAHVVKSCKALLMNPSRLDDKELSDAQHIASALMESEKHMKNNSVEWTYYIPADLIEQVESSFNRHLSALTVVFRSHAESELRDACRRLTSLYESTELIEFTEELRTAADKGVGSDPKAFRDKIIQVLLKNTALSLWMIRIGRRPE